MKNPFKQFSRRLKMANNDIFVPTKTYSYGREFPALKINGVEKALKECEDAGYNAIFMPKLADTRLDAPKDAVVWKNWYTTPSIRATGRTKISNISQKDGTPVVAYAHIPNYFSEPDNIRTSREKGLRNGAGILPNNEFQRLLDLEDYVSVFVLDYNILRNAPSKVIPVSKALKHPQTIPFLGGKDKAEKYLDGHKEVYGNKIGIWHSDDLDEQPRGLLLFLGSNCYEGLSGNVNLSNIGRFVGERGAPQNLVLPYTLDDIQKVREELEVLKNLVNPESVASIDALLLKLSQ